MITQEILKEYLHYDPDTGFFTWLKSAGKRVKAGMVAGALTSDGYIQIKLLGRVYKAHRLAWFYIAGEWPKEYIDHINGVKNDNRISNIRQATQAENMKNTVVPKTNKSGFKGVCWDKAKNKWLAQLKLYGKTKYLGLFEKPEDASLAYQNAARKYHGEFFNERMAK